MSSRELIVLGTASQVPTRFRNHNGYLLRWDDEGLLFDPGEGTQRQMIYAGVAVSSVTKIFITHFHGDHCLGLPGILQRISLDQVSHPVEVYFPASGRAYYDRLRRASIYRDSATIIPRPISEPGVVFDGKQFNIEAVRLDHGVDTFGYRLNEYDSVTMLPEKLAELGIRGPAIGELKRQGSIEHEGRTIDVADVSLHKPGQSFAFVMDTRLCPAVRTLARDTDLFVCESTYLASERREAQNNGHMTAAQAARVARDENARRLVLTHFSQRYPSVEVFLHEARGIHSDVFAARDGERVSVPKREES